MQFIHVSSCILPGRAGRVSKGFCYRLVSRHFWEHEIPDFTIPEMLVREQLHVCQWQQNVEDLLK